MSNNANNANNKVEPIVEKVVKAALSFISRMCLNDC
jgi:hypothetical protein